MGLLGETGNSGAHIDLPHSVSDTHGYRVVEAQQLHNANTIRLELGAAYAVARQVDLGQSRISVEEVFYFKQNPFVNLQVGASTTLLRDRYIHS